MRPVIRIDHLLHAVLFGALLLAPWLVWLSIPNKLSNQNFDNRKLAEAPIFIQREKPWSQLPSEIVRYINDNFPGRSDMLHLLGTLRFSLFDKALVPQVIVGRDKWLFHNDGVMLQVYQGNRGMNRNETLDADDYILSWEQWARKRGITFAVALAPSKFSLYPDKLPMTYRRPQGGENLVKNFLANDLPGQKYLVDLSAGELRRRELAPNLQSFRLNDTHWNELGAFWAVQTLFEHLKARGVAVSVPSLADYDVTQLPEPGGNLARMIAFPRLLEPYWVEVRPKHRPFSSTLIEKDPEERVIRYRGINAERPKALIYRDSFATAALPMLADAFSETVFIWKNTPDEGEIEREKPDVLIIWLLETKLLGMPYLPRPKRQQ